MEKGKSISLSLFEAQVEYLISNNHDIRIVDQMDNTSITLAELINRLTNQKGRTYRIFSESFRSRSRDYYFIIDSSLTYCNGNIVLMTNTTISIIIVYNINEEVKNMLKSFDHPIAVEFINLCSKINEVLELLHDIPNIILSFNQDFTTGNLNKILDLIIADIDILGRIRLQPF